MSARPENFISYVHEDLSHLEKKAYFEPLKRWGLIQPWHDTAISPGANFAPSSKGLRVPWAYLILIIILLLTSTGCNTLPSATATPVSYTHLRAHETRHDL